MDEWKMNAGKGSVRILARPLMREIQLILQNLLMFIYVQCGILMRF